MSLATLALAATCCCVIVQAGKTIPPPGLPPKPQGPPPVQYEFQYAVEDRGSGVVTHRWEHRYGEYVKGAYSLLGADGKVRIVDYEVDGDKGFHAVIRTHYPPSSLLSVQQLERVKQKSGQPRVNVLTNQPLPAPGLSGNYHSTSPYYYLELAKTRPPPRKSSYTTALLPPLPPPLYLTG